MAKCTERNPELRPTFQDVLHVLLDLEAGEMYLEGPSSEPPTAETDPAPAPISSTTEEASTEGFSLIEA